MEELKQQRDETEQARAGSNSRGGTGEPAEPVLSAAQEAKKRKLDERRALIEAKRQKVSVHVDFDLTQESRLDIVLIADMVRETDARREGSGRAKEEGDTRSGCGCVITLGRTRDGEREDVACRTCHIPSRSQAASSSVCSLSLLRPLRRRASLSDTIASPFGFSRRHIIAVKPSPTNPTALTES